MPSEGTPRVQTGEKPAFQYALDINQELGLGG